MSASGRDRVLEYLRTRFAPALFLPLALLIAAVALAAGEPTGIAAAATASMLAATLLLQFRLWDDLADLDVDRRLHPDRTLCRAPSRRPFHCLLLLTALINVGLVVLQPRPLGRLLLLLLLNTVFAAWYLGRRPSVERTWGRGIVLVKYPMFVLLVSGWAAGPTADRLWLTMTLVYLCFCIHEIVHEPPDGSERPLGVLVVLLLASAALSVLLLSRHAPAAAWLQLILTLASAGGLLLLLRLHRSRSVSRSAGYAPLVIGFALALNFSLGV